MYFSREHGCVDPYLAALHTSSLVQYRVWFVEVAREISSNCTVEVQAGTRISRCHELSGCGTSLYRALYKCQVHLQHSIYEFICLEYVLSYVLIAAYV